MAWAQVNGTSTTADVLTFGSGVVPTLYLSTKAQQWWPITIQISAVNCVIKGHHESRRPKQDQQLDYPRENSAIVSSNTEIETPDFTFSLARVCEWPKVQYNRSIGPF